MARGGDRFRRLRTPRTGDLFEHFGVRTEPGPPPEDPGRSPTAVISAAACADCGWYRPVPLRGACPVCGAPQPQSTEP